MLDFTTYNYIGNSSTPLRLGSLGRPSRVVDSRYSLESGDDGPALQPVKQFSSLTLAGRQVSSRYSIDLGDVLASRFTSAPAFGFSRVVEFAYDAYDPSVITGGMPDPVIPPVTVQNSDWGTLGATSDTDDYGLITDSAEPSDWGNLS